MFLGNSSLAITGQNRHFPNPASFFSSSINGFSFDVQDSIAANKSSGVWGVSSGWTATQLGTCRIFQDDAGTTPVYALNQPVGLIKDVSGHGNNLYNSGDVSTKPTVQVDSDGMACLRFNGTSSYLQHDTLDLSSSNKVTLVTRLLKTADTSLGTCYEFSTNSATFPGGFALLAPQGASIPGYLFKAGITALRVVATPTGYPSPIGSVISGVSNTAAPTLLFRVDGQQLGVTNTADPGTGTFGNYTGYIGSRAGTSFFFSGDIYNLTVIGTELSSEQLVALETQSNRGKVF